VRKEYGDIVRVILNTASHDSKWPGTWPRQPAVTARRWFILVDEGGADAVDTAVDHGMLTKGNSTKLAWAAS